ncbi:MAG: photosynthetic reaction center cytochrome c subunit [Acidobacteriia bacterium]|nr:photosynthetic reaction center cytochrome c subunit [Terriglobia bacterium]
MRSRLWILVAAAGSLSAQTRQVDIMPLMQEIVTGLGVQCEYCHSARGSGQPEPKKDIARQMIAMTRDLNARVQTATGKSAAEATQVSCITCHHGVPIPKQLSEVVTQTLREKGVAAAAAQYRDLHEHFYGRAAYDFGEDTLIGVAQPLAAGRPDDAIALLKLNLEFFPQSAKTYAAIGFAYTRKYDDPTAITYYEKSVELDPNNGVTRGQLEQLKMYQRKR